MGSFWDKVTKGRPITRAKTPIVRVAVQLPLIGTTSAWRKPNMSSLPDPALLSHVAIDLETRDDGLRDRKGPAWPWQGGAVLGIGVAWDNGEVYLPIKSFVNNDPDVLVGEERERSERWFGDVLRLVPVKTAHNASYDCGWLRTLGYKAITGVEDTLIMTTMLDEFRRSYKLGDIAREIIGATKTEGLLDRVAAEHGLHPKRELFLLPARFYGAYGANDARITYDLAVTLRERLAAQGLTAAAAIEYRAQAVLTSMRANGVRVDVEGAQRAREAIEIELKGLHTTLGGRNVWGPEMAVWLETKGYRLPKTAKGRPSLTKAVLAAMPHDPLMAAIHRTRQLEKLKSTYIDGFVLGKQINGRLHPEWHQLRSDAGGAITGRCTSSNPSLQVLPRVDDEDDEADFGRIVRGFMLPEPGEQWAAADFKGQEPRLALHLALLAHVPGVASYEEQYRANPNTDFYRVLMDLTQQPKAAVKTMGLGRMYGMGNAKLCKALGYPTAVNEEGREIAGDEGLYVIEQFDRLVPWVRDLANRVSRTAEQRGYLVTIGGRRVRFRDGNGRPCIDPKTGYPISPHKALNRIVQGGAADQIKRAMLAISDRGLGDRLRVTVHDEVGCSTRTAEERAEIVDCMIGAMPMRIPASVDLAVGDSWGAARE